MREPRHPATLRRRLLRRRLLFYELAKLPGDAGMSATVVWWHQRIGEFDEFEQIAYDQALEAGEAQRVPLTALSPPFAENLICYRACRDRLECDCLNLPAVALGSIVVAQDRDGNGRVSVEEVRHEQVGGLSNVLIGWSENAHDSLPMTWAGYFEAVVEGVCPYEYGRAGIIGALTPIQDTTVLRWQSCPASDVDCAFETPELLCLWDRCEEQRGLNRFGL